MVPIKDVKKGSILIADESFPCMKNGQEYPVLERDPDGLCVDCRYGIHWLHTEIGGPNDAFYIGFTLKAE